MAEPTSKRRTENTNKRFSDRLESWLEGDESKTIGALTDLIDEKSFVLVIMLLLFPSALPIPTGGVTHVLELIAALAAGQMILGRRELWLPRRFRLFRRSRTLPRCRRGRGSLRGRPRPR